jgi:hypothetical protein
MAQGLITALSPKQLQKEDSLSFYSYPTQLQSDVWAIRTTRNEKVDATTP